MTKQKAIKILNTVLSFGRCDCLKEEIEECLKMAIKALTVQSAQPQYEELTPEEAAAEIAGGSIMSASYWLDAMMRLKQMGYVICRKR